MTTPTTCSKCGRFAIGLCEICKQPTCGVHQANADGIAPGSNWHVILNGIGAFATLSRSDKEATVRKLESDLRLAHLQCRIDSISIESVTYPDPAKIARKIADRPYDLEVWKYSWKHHLFGGDRLVKERMVNQLWSITETPSSRYQEVSGYNNDYTQRFILGLGLDHAGQLWTYEREHRGPDGQILGSLPNNELSWDRVREVRSYDYEHYYHALRGFEQVIA